MKFDEFKVGLVFYTGAGAWVCTDVGRRVVVAARKSALDVDPSGPPYSISEDVFDEYDLDGCRLEPYPPETKR